MKTTPQVGDLIRFKLDDGNSSTEAKVIRLISDPLSRHETKLMVDIAGEFYGIPESYVMAVDYKSGVQLSLF